MFISICVTALINLSVTFNRAWIVVVFCFFFSIHYKSQTDINKILQSPGIYILLPGRL